MSSNELFIRKAVDSDRTSIVELCRETLRWDPSAPNTEFFAWKHDDNPFGTSPMWVAELDGKIVGLRTLLRWEFSNNAGKTARAVRAVDTTTHPNAQGQGIFTRLTTHAIDDLAIEGVRFIFNTPNDQSRPGYLKMGWNVVGKVPLAVHPKNPLVIAKMSSSTERAEKWSQPCEYGEVASDAFARGTHIPTRRQLASNAAWSTNRTGDYLRWRYSFEPLHYRVVSSKPHESNSNVVFRLHVRGELLEATLVDVLGNWPRPSMWRRILSETGADYLICSAPPRTALASGFVPLPFGGPQLTQRQIPPQAISRVDDFDMALGDVELF